MGEKGFCEGITPVFMAADAVAWVGFLRTAMDRPPTSLRGLPRSDVGGFSRFLLESVGKSV